MTNRLRLLAASVLTGALTGALALGAAPAQAATYDHDDATGDVRRALLGMESDLTLAAQERAADITQLRVRHGRSRLIMRLETRALTRRSGQTIGPAFLIDTPERRYVASVSSVSLAGDTSRVVYFDTSGPRRARTRCDGLFADLDFDANVSMLSVPRSCLGDPRRVQIKAVMLKSTVEGRRFTDYLDSAMDDRRFRPISWTPSIRSGPRRAV